MRSAPDLPPDAAAGGYLRLVPVLSLSLLAHALLLWLLQGLPAAVPGSSATVRMIDLLLVRGDTPAAAPVQPDTPRAGIPVPQPATEPQADRPRLAAAPAPAAPAARRAARLETHPRAQPARVERSAVAAASPPATTRAQPAASGPGKAAPAPERRPGIIPVYTPEPEYPGMARRLGLEGRVLLHVLMALNGIPEEVTVISSSGHPLLDKAAIKAIRSWRFSVNLAGSSLAAPPSIDIPVRFQLN